MARARRRLWGYEKEAEDEKHLAQAFVRDIADPLRGVLRARPRLGADNAGRALRRGRHTTGRGEEGG